MHRLDPSVILHSFFQVSQHKFIESALARHIYQIVIAGNTSFKRTSKIINRSIGQTANGMIDPQHLIFFPRKKQQERLPRQFSLTGKSGVSARLTEQDVRAVFFKLSAALRASGVDGSELAFPVGPRRGAFSSETIIFVSFINSSVEAEDYYLAKGHTYVDCATALIDDVKKFIRAIVLDGVTATCPVCAEPGCCAELENTTRHRYCKVHFKEHYCCGVRKGPNKEGRCRRFVASVTEDDDAEAKAKRKFVPKSKQGNMTCKEHAMVEKEYLK